LPVDTAVKVFSSPPVETSFLSEVTAIDRDIQRHIQEDMAELRDRHRRNLLLPAGSQRKSCRLLRRFRCGIASSQQQCADCQGLQFLFHRLSKSSHSPDNYNTSVCAICA
jgi:hypothetical protein